MSNNAKSGLSFPLLVIAGALAIGGAGFFVLYRMYEKNDASIRDTSSLGSVEGKLIEELQRKTNAEMTLRDTVIALQQIQIDGLLARKSEARDDPAETARLEREIAERGKIIAGLEAEKTAIMENYWKELAADIPPDTPMQAAIVQVLEKDWAELPDSVETIRYESVEDTNADSEREDAAHYEHIIEQLKKENTSLAARIEERDSKILQLSATIDALERSRRSMNE